VGGRVRDQHAEPDPVQFLPADGEDHDASLEPGPGLAGPLLGYPGVASDARGSLPLAGDSGQYR
jgi:hypothetical protein